MVTLVGGGGAREALWVSGWLVEKSQTNLHLNSSTRLELPSDKQKACLPRVLHASRGCLSMRHTGTHTWTRKCDSSETLAHISAMRRGPWAQFILHLPVSISKCETEVLNRHETGSFLRSPF